MAADSHIRNPTWPNDNWGPKTAVQPRLTGTSQEGRLVITDNPVSYIMEPARGRYYPILSLRGHTDSLTRDIGEQIQFNYAAGSPPPANQEPRHGAFGFNGSKALSSTAGAVTRPPRRLMPNTTLRGVGPLGMSDPERPFAPSFFSGLPDGVNS